MNLLHVLWTFILVQYSRANFLGLNLGPACINLIQLNTATQILCNQERNNKSLWAKVIACHRPMTDEFMRSSGEAQCPLPKYVQDPTNTKYSIEDVFFNICGFVNGNVSQQLQGGFCLVFGKDKPKVMSHSKELSELKSKWGKNLPCNIGVCIKKLLPQLGH